MLRGDVWRMVRRRASDAGIETAIGYHTFRATGITDHLTNGGRIEVAQRMAGHSNAKTTRLHDRHNDDISVGEVERTGIEAVIRIPNAPKLKKVPPVLTFFLSASSF
jgi:integrase/recombinase XerD